MIKHRSDQESVGGGNFFFLLRWWAGDHKQSDFAARTGIPASEISRIEHGRQKPRTVTLNKLLAGAGVPDRLLGSLRWCYRLLRQARTMSVKVDLPPREPRPSAALQAASLEAIDRSLVLARMACRLRRLQEGAPGLSPARAETLFERLKSLSAANQRLLLEASPSYRDPVLCVRFCRESEKVATGDPALAQPLAETAQLIARHLPEAVRPRAELAALEAAMRRARRHPRP